MMSREEQEMHIRMVEAALCNINTELSDQLSMTVETDAETEKILEQIRTLSLGIAQLNEECEDSKQINIKLSATRMELKRKCDAIGEKLKFVESEVENNFQLLNKQRLENQNLTMQYEDTMWEAAKEIRNMAIFYKTHDIKQKIDGKKAAIRELKEEQAELDELILDIKNKIQNTACSVPDNILDIVGKTALENHLQTIVNDIEEHNKEFNTD